MTQHTDNNNSQNIISCTNEQFLQAVFRQDMNRAHVTVFHEDPNAISGRVAWMGGHWGNLKGNFTQGGNQYYTISTFNNSPDGVARRRKDLFYKTYVIVIDDVGTGPSAKVDPLDPRILPPSFAIETSRDNCQYGYILSIPEANGSRVVTLLDGMVSAGIADGKDPGMKGLTRYVRLPEGTNNKAKYVEVLGAPFKCQTLVWEPFKTFSLEELAAPFSIDLDAEVAGRDFIGDVDSEGHPAYDSMVSRGMIKSKLGPNNFDVTCPWVEEHTGMDDSGTAVTLYPDGKCGLACHHGHGDEKRGMVPIMKWLHEHDPGLKMREIQYGFGPTMSSAPPAAPAPDSVGPSTFDHETQQPVAQGDAAHLAFCRNNGIALDIGTHADRYVEMCQSAASCAMVEMRESCINEIKKVFGFNRLTDIRDRVEEFLPALQETLDPEIVQRYIHIKTMHKFLDRANQTIISAEALNQSWDSGDDQAQQSFKDAGGYSVDELTWQPCAYTAQPQEFIQDGALVQANTYIKPADVPDFAIADVTPYIGHAEFLIPDADERRTVLDHMAYSMQHPEIKINWQILLFGEQGTGKDTLLLPLAQYFRNMYRDIKAGDDNANQWGDMYFKKKVLVFQEVYRPRDKKFSNELKTLAANTAGGQDVLNIKGKGQVSQPNLYSMYMFSNHQDPLHLEHGDRRVFPVGDHDLQAPSAAYFDTLYAWLNDKGGLTSVVHWLLHRDLSQFNPNRMPFHTEARESIIEHSRSEAAIAIEEAMMLERGPFSRTSSCFSAKMVYKYLIDQGERYMSVSQVAQELGSLGIEKLGRVKKVMGGKAVRAHIMANPNYTGHEESGTIMYDDLTTHAGKLKAYTRCSFGV